VKFVCLADTHNLHQLISVPDGDVLIHAGDFCTYGHLDEVARFADWFRELPHPHKIVVAGNHDRVLENAPELAEPLLSDFIYLRDSAVDIEGVTIYGSPWQPWFYDWAFQRHRGEPMREIWRRVPAGVDILITHGPMHGVGDRTSTGVHAGCEALRDEILERIRPAIHLCGHIHEGRGRYEVDGIVSINASSVNLAYQLFAEPATRFDYAREKVAP